MREVRAMSTDDIVSRTRLLENEIRIMRLEQTRITHEIQNQRDKIRENSEKIKVNKTLPYLVSNVIEVRKRERDCVHLHFHLLINSFAVIFVHLRVILVVKIVNIK